MGNEQRTCRSCKHWEDVFSQHPRPMTSGMCALTLSEGDGGAPWVEPTHPSSKAYAYGTFPDEDVFTRLMLITKPDFSCNQWRKR